MVVVLFHKSLSCSQINETTLWPANKVNIPRLSDVRSSSLGCSALGKLSVALGNTDPLKHDESGCSKTEGPKWQILWVQILKSHLSLHVGEVTIDQGSQNYTVWCPGFTQTWLNPKTFLPVRNNKKYGASCMAPQVISPLSAVPVALKQVNVV